jgi:hypothetical protein
VGDGRTRGSNQDRDSSVKSLLSAPDLLASAGLTLVEPRRRGRLAAATTAWAPDVESPARR